MAWIAFLPGERVFICDQILGQLFIRRIVLSEWWSILIGAIRKQCNNVVGVERSW